MGRPKQKIPAKVSRESHHPGIFSLLCFRKAYCIIKENVFNKMFRAAPPLTLRVPSPLGGEFAPFVIPLHLSHEALAKWDGGGGPPSGGEGHPPLRFAALSHPWEGN